MLPFRMPFETFERRTAQRSGRGVPVVRITEKGDLAVFNAAAARLMQGVTHVQLLWDADTRRMAFRPTTAEDLNGFSIGRPASAANVGVKAFVRQYEIPVGQRFIVDEQDGLFIADVAAPLTAGGN